MGRYRHATACLAPYCPRPASGAVAGADGTRPQPAQGERDHADHPDRDRHYPHRPAGDGDAVYGPMRAGAPPSNPRISRPCPLGMGRRYARDSGAKGILRVHTRGLLLPGRVRPSGRPVRLTPHPAPRPTGGSSGRSQRVSPDLRAGGAKGEEDGKSKGWFPVPGWT